MTKRKWMGIAAICLLVAGAAGIIFFGGRLIQRNNEYTAAQNEYSQLRANFITTGASASSQANGASAVAGSPSDIDIAALRQKNPDCIGWIEIPGTDISYPIMQGATNETYLRHTFDKSYLLSGSIFMDFRNSSDYSDFNTIIFGHNMRDNTMFSALESYLDEDFLTANSVIYIHTESGVLTYNILMAKKTDINDMAYQVINPDAAGTKRFLADFEPLEANYASESRYITLSTCADGNDKTARTLIVAELV